MWQPGRGPVNNPLMPWYEAIDQPGAGQMQYGRWLMESRPFLTRVPDDSILVTHRSDHTQLDAQRDGIVSTKLTHVVYTRDQAGKAVLYVNGAVIQSGDVRGDLSDWEDDFRLALGNELTGDRPWLGELYRVALYDRALDAGQIARLAKAGRDQSATGALVLYEFREGTGQVVRDTSGTRDCAASADQGRLDRSVARRRRPAARRTVPDRLAGPRDQGDRSREAVEGHHGGSLDQAREHGSGGSGADRHRLARHERAQFHAGSEGRCLRGPFPHDGDLAQRRAGHRVAGRRGAECARRADLRPRCGALPVRRHPRHRGHLRDGLRTGRTQLPGADGRHHRREVRAWWYNPRNGQATEIGTFDNKGEREFTPPDPGEMADWVLVLDDAAKNYPAPGTRKSTARRGSAARRGSLTPPSRRPKVSLSWSAVA
jgi:hypothetical protein